MSATSVPSPVHHALNGVEPKPLGRRAFSGIVLVGPMCAGKTTLADALVAAGVADVRVSLATPVKNLCMKWFGMSDDPAKKDRARMQEVATTLRAELFDGVFIASLMYRDDVRDKTIVVDDSRFPEEQRALRNVMLIVRVEVDEAVRKERVRLLYGDVPTKEATHSSETASDSDESRRLCHASVRNDTELDRAEAVATIRSLMYPPL